jgi:hypothetical protein
VAHVDGLVSSASSVTIPSRSCGGLSTGIELTPFVSGERDRCIQPRAGSCTGKAAPISGLGWQVRVGFGVEARAAIQILIMIDCR